MFMGQEHGVEWFMVIASTFLQHKEQNHEFVYLFFFTSLFILLTSLCSEKYYFQYIKEEADTQRGEGTYPSPCEQ